MHVICSNTKKEGWVIDCSSIYLFHFGNHKGWGMNCIHMGENKNK